MTATRLREAATRLRGLADAATPGPWVAEEGASGAWWIERQYREDIALELTGGNANLIAVMDPVVAGLLAAWLDAQEDVWGKLSTKGMSRTYVAASALAEAVLA